MAVSRPAPAVSTGMLTRRCCEQLAEIERAEVHDQQKEREQEAEVANAVDDEGFLAGVGGASPS